MMTMFTFIHQMNNASYMRENTYKPAFLVKHATH